MLTFEIPSAAYSRRGYIGVQVKTRPVRYGLDVVLRGLLTCYI